MTLRSAPTRAAARPAPAKQGRRLSAQERLCRTGNVGHGLPLRCKGTDRGEQLLNERGFFLTVRRGATVVWWRAGGSRVIRAQ